MNNPDSQAIVNRFFETFDRLIERGVIKNEYTFSKTYGIDRRNFASSRNNPASNYFQMAWISYLVKDYEADCNYIIMGKKSRAAVRRKSIQERDTGANTIANNKINQRTHLMGK